jgi:hypothetical protein
MRGCFPLAGRRWRVLVVHALGGRREPIALTFEMSQDKLARALESWGMTLEDAPAEE